MPSALTWLKAHRRAALDLLGAVVLVAAGWALHRPAPRVELHDHLEAQVHQQEHHQVEAHAAAHQAEQATATQHLEQHRRVHVHQVEHVLPTGEKTVITDTTEGEDLVLEQAQQVVLHINTASTILGALDLTRTATASRDTTVVQTPAAAPSLRLWGELGAQVGLPPEPYAGVGAGLRLAKVPLVPAQIWLAGEGRFRPTQAPEGRVGLRVEIEL